jgi:hypothetical protein
MGMQKDLHHLLETPTKSIDSGAKTDGTVNGASQDLKGYRSCFAFIDADAWTDGTHTCALNESDDNSTFTVVAAADLEFTEAGPINSSGQIVIDGAADDDAAFKVGYAGSSRYVRWEIVTTGATTGAIIGGGLIAGHKRLKGKLNQ